MFRLYILKAFISPAEVDLLTLTSNIHCILRTADEGTSGGHQRLLWFPVDHVTMKKGLFSDDQGLCCCSCTPLCFENQMKPLETETLSQVTHTAVHARDSDVGT